MITLSLDVTLLDKARFKRVKRKNGENAVFCDLVLIETPQGKYGDFMVKQSVTKEERAAKKEMPILGNGKNWSHKTAGPSAASGSDGPETDRPVPF